MQYSILSFFPSYFDHLVALECREDPNDPLVAQYNPYQGRHHYQERFQTVRQYLFVLAATEFHQFRNLAN